MSHEMERARRARRRHEKFIIHNFSGKPEGKIPFACLGADGAIILKWILKKEGVTMRDGIMWLDRVK
jgi:hypothetical protein